MDSDLFRLNTALRCRDQEYSGVAIDHARTCTYESSAVNSGHHEAAETAISFNKTAEELWGVQGVCMG